MFFNKKKLQKRRDELLQEYEMHQQIVNILRGIKAGNYTLEEQLEYRQGVATAAYQRYCSLNDILRNS